MTNGWQIIAFPLILPWREEFWTLPLYFADLKVGVTPGWPAILPYQGMALPPPAAVLPGELRHYHAGELTQQQAYKAYLEAREEVGDIVRELKGLPKEEVAAPSVEAQAVSLAWELEKMEAEQEAQMALVDRGHNWLAEILAPEPWEETPSFAGVPGLKEMVDPDMARLRFALWQRELAAEVKGPWVPFLLGRTSRAIFSALKGWPRWTQVAKATISLPGIKREAAWREAGEPPWREDFRRELEALLAAAASGAEALAAQAPRFQEFVAEAIAGVWPGALDLNWDLEIWAQDPEEEEEFGPVLCWGGVNTDILPG